MTPRVHIPGMNAVLCVGSPDREISVNGELFLFEWHSYCGPHLVDRRNGNIRDTQPKEGHPWWDAVIWWHRQSCRMRNDLCVWNREHKPKVKFGGTMSLGGVRGHKVVGVKRGACCELEEGS